jgi:hypothetical protein
MLRRIGLVLLAVTLVAAAVPALEAAPSISVPADGIKGATPPDEFEPEIPATTQLGLIIMVLLVMTASSAALLGGGIFKGGLSERLAPATKTQNAAAAKDRAPRGKVSPKNKSKRAFARQRERQAQARKGWNAARRGGTHAKPRRRGGPGCRGVR